MLYNRFLERVVLPLGDFLTGSIVMKTLRCWRKISVSSEEQITELAEEKLRKILNFSVQKVPYYRNIVKECEENPYEWIKHFPIMKKKDIKENIDTLLSMPKETLIKSETSGSSGERGLVYKSKREISIGRALILLIWEWAGFYPGKPILQTGITVNRGFVKKMKDILLRTRYTIAFGLSDKELLPILQKQRGKENFHIAGYASSLYVLSEICLRAGIENVKFDKAISLGDKMFPHYRNAIKTAFGCDVVDTYGISEGIVIAAQKDLDYYYILSPHVYLELVDDEGRLVPDGELGHVIVTSLDAYAMPLIRYYTGDLAVKLPRSKYPKRREFKFPLLEKVIGRDTDIVKTVSGKYMIVHFFTGIFEFISEIRQFRVIQRDLNCMEIEYIPAENFREQVLKEIEQTIWNFLKEPFEIHWIRVDYISPTASGKPQIIQSFLSPKKNDA